MGFETFSSGDSSTEEESTDPSGTHIYFYEEGHDRLPQDEEVAETLARAYELAKSQPREGPVRTFSNRGWSGGLQQMLAEFVVSVGDMLEQEDPSILMDGTVGDLPEDVQAKAIWDYLESNPEVGQQIESRITGAEKEPAEADD